VESKQCYVPKSNFGTRKEKVNLYIEIINVANIVVGNDSKPYSLRGDVVTPNNDSNKEDSLKGMSSLVDDISNLEC